VVAVRHKTATSAGEESASRSLDAGACVYGNRAGPLGRGVSSNEVARALRKHCVGPKAESDGYQEPEIVLIGGDATCSPTARARGFCDREDAALRIAKRQERSFVQRAEAIGLRTWRCAASEA